MRTNKRGPSIEIVETPQRFINLMRRRVEPIVVAWGRGGGFDSEWTLMQLCISCYSQGVEDVGRIYQRDETQPVNDFQI